MAQSKKYGSLDTELTKAIMKLFKLREGYLYASRRDESSEWRVVHRWQGHRETLGTLKEILGQL